MELDERLDRVHVVYIFGTGSVAKRIFNLLSKENKEKVKGFIVSSTEGNPKDFCGRPVCVLGDDRIDNRATILVSVSENYHPEVYNQLRTLGFANIISAIRFFSLEVSSVNDSEKTDSAILEEFLDDKCELTATLRAFRNELINDCVQSSHAFGNRRFYQSLPSLGIKGDRPTDVRINDYRLKRYLRPNFAVLDIGCNTGFLDIEISNFVRTIIGIEYNDTLVAMGWRALKALNIDNVTLVAADYNSWQKNNHCCFDAIFSFAVHIWLDVAPKEYARQLNDMLKPDGYLIFESQTYANDKLFPAYVEALENVGLALLEDQKIMDDGKTERRFVVLRKT